MEMRLLFTLLILGSIVDECWMDGSLNRRPKRVRPNSSSLPIELLGPTDYVALGGNDLRLRYRLEAGLTTPPISDSLTSIQLTFQEDDGTESFVATAELLLLPSQEWNQVVFECGVVVRGGVYHIRLVSSPRDIYYVKTMNGVSVAEPATGPELQVAYPTIDFEVPHLLETYTTSVRVSLDLTRSLCKPQRALPATALLLTRPSALINEPSRDLSPTIMENPLGRLEREGQVSVTVECHLWARNGTYHIEIQEKSMKRRTIAKSEPIKVEWSSRFGLNLTKKSIIPCRGNVRVSVTYPACVLPGKDRVRVYGYETLPVPSLLAPKRLSYISEKQVKAGRDDGQILSFSCALFPQRFLQYCFQYVNTAEDESVAIVVENCIPTFPPDELSDGGWGSWSSWSECSASCGTEGRRFRFRFCDAPPPSFGANYCQGDSIEEGRCEEDGDLPECFPEATTANETPESSEIISPEAGSAGRRGTGTAVATQPRGPPHLVYRTMHLNSTLGCECGCLLHDLVPGLNYSLRIALSANHSACEDQDEEEHHNLKWILHSKGEGNHIKFHILEADIQCVTVSFRDGNTTDSNLLEVISTETVLGTRDPLDQDSSIEDLVMMTIESSGGSLSIAASDEAIFVHNCSAPYIYFFAFYQIVSSPPTDQPAAVSSWLDKLESWSFLPLKLGLVVFIAIALCSLGSGCATKVYKYKELRWSKSDDYYCETDEEGEAGRRVGADGADETRLLENTSRTTSVTIMSFDYAYWNQLRALRLKYYLLRPRTLNILTSRVKSFPNTPTHVKKRPARPPKKAVCFQGLPDERGLLKSVSLSDTNLETLKRRKGYRDEARVPVSGKAGTCEPSSGCDAELTESHSATVTLSPPDSSPRVSPTPKERKEEENLKRKERRRKRRRKPDSSLLLKTETEDFRSSSEMCNNSTSELNSMNDFEMDYYDYDILNAGTIPGSYLLEPSYAFWTDSMYDDPVSGSDLGPGDMEMSSRSIGGTDSSVGLFTPEPSTSSKDLGVKETSLDTFDTFDSQIRFADDDDEDDTVTISDSFDDLTSATTKLKDNGNQKERDILFLSTRPTN